MAKWSASARNWTPTGVADATNFTDSGHHTLQGGSGTQLIRIQEVYMGGLATATSPCPMIVAHDSTVGATLSGGFGPVAMHPSSAALAAPALPFSIATTKPQRSATLQLLQLAFNANGGIVRWVAAPDEEVQMLGNTASLGEVSLSMLNAGTAGALSSHFIFEPM